MTYERLYIVCILFTSLVEVTLALDFFGTFHSIRRAFEVRERRALLWGIAIAINVGMNLLNNSYINFFGVLVLYFVMCFLFVEGNLWSRIFHWLIFVLTGLSVELIFAFILNIATDVPTNLIYENSFMMVSGILSMKLLQFLVLMLIKQVSRITVKKVSGGVFGAFVIVPVGSIGIMFLIPYIRDGGTEFTTMDLFLLVFYIILFLGNIILFYVFTSYNKMREETLLQQMNQVKYEERLLLHDRQGEIDEKYKEHIHNIKYYLKQIGFYLDENETEKIKNVLEQLKVSIYQEEDNIICANRFLNLLLLDFKREAKHRKVIADVFVEPGFKIEFMEEIDMISMFGNLLDNALEASEKCKKGEIYVDLYMENDGSLVVCRIKNKYEGQIMEKDKQLLTTKKDSLRHGLGVQSVKNLVEKYNGHIQIEFQDGVYTTTVLFSRG